MELICYKNCSTCKAVERSMKEKNMSYTYREITEEIPTKEELKEWIRISGEALTKWLNTSGRAYRQMNLSEKRKTLSEDKILELMEKDGMLIKRPILVIDAHTVYVGKAVSAYLEACDARDDL